MRVRVDVCRAVLVTSVVWFLVDVFVLFYFLDPGASPKKNDVHTRGERDLEKPQHPEQLVDRKDERVPAKPSEPTDAKVDGILARLMKGTVHASVDQWTA